MHKSVFIAVFSLLTISCFSQTWQDELEEARKLYSKKEYNAALKHYQQAQNKAPKNVDLSEEIAQTNYRKANYKLAEQQLHKKTKSATSLHNLGNTKMQQQDYQAAVEAYKKSLKINPDAPDTQYNLAQALRKLKQQQQQNKQQNQSQSQDKKKQDDKNKDEKSQDKTRQDENKQESQLAKNETERLLDELTKKEIETKKKLNTNKGKNSSSNSGKDW